jgi:hypothetical protein
LLSGCSASYAEEVSGTHAGQPPQGSQPANEKRVGNCMCATPAAIKKGYLYIDASGSRKDPQGGRRGLAKLRGRGPEPTPVAQPGRTTNNHNRADGRPEGRVLWRAHAICEHSARLSKWTPWDTNPWPSACDVNAGSSIRRPCLHVGMQERSGAVASLLGSSPAQSNAFPLRSSCVACGDEMVAIDGRRDSFAAYGPLVAAAGFTQCPLSSSATQH